MAMAVESNASVNNAYCLINMMVWEMLTEFQQGNLLGNLYLEDWQDMEG